MKMKRCHTSVLIWIGLIVGTIGKFVTGSVFVFNVYQEDIKVSFNYSQKEIELLSSLLNIGLGVGFLPGMFYDKFGPRWTSLVGLLISVGGYMLLWSTTKAIMFYKSKSGMMAFYFFLSGFGSVFTYMVALNTNVVNFPDKHRGKIVGSLDACFSGSASLLSLVYYKVFVTSTTNSAYPSFLLFLVVLFTSSGVLCLLFLRVYDTTEEYSSIVNIKNPCYSQNFKQLHDDLDMKEGFSEDGVKQTIEENEPNAYTSQQLSEPELERIPQICNGAEPRPLKIQQILKNCDYLLLTSIFGIASCIGLLTQNNITVISKSTYLSEHDPILVAVISASNATISIGIGFMSDWLKERVPRMIFIVISCGTFTVCSILAIFSENNFGALLSSAVLSGLATGVLWTITPTVISEMFHTSNLGRNWGMAILSASILGMGAQYAFGFLYDEKKSAGELFCFGGYCVLDGLGMCVGLSLLSTILSIVFTVRKRITHNSHSQ